MIKYSDCQVHPLREHKNYVISDIKYKDVTVPSGYRTNGANIPRIFWSIYPPNRPDYQPAVIFHDFMCDQAKCYEDYKKADDYFEEILTYLQINKFDIFVLTRGVRLYHKIKYGGGK